MTSVLKKSRGTKGKSESMQEDLPSRWGEVSRENKSEDVAKLIKCIDDNIIGRGNSFCGPFGRRKGKIYLVFLFHRGSLHLKSRMKIFRCFILLQMPKVLKN